ncbi:tight adherence protein C [Paenibacillus catalpae]|uniref:Tight adherence protein C n=1 Tax=Paenibacillus catalpae TaxID=1045775 RepID=A0A1I2AEZ4_9BACL|nr:type II secretion system F family protein [Paenibacillus catalpae]SFE42369.1 tight adherence protein C [Paenibacillus catalpae]
MAVLVLLLALFWALLIGKDGLAQLQKREKPDWKGLLLIKPFDLLLERSKFYEYLQLPLSSYHSKQILLKGTDWQLNQTRLHIAETTGYGYAVLAGCSLLAVLAKEPVLIGMGVLLGVLLPVRPFMEAGRMVERRKQAIISELPEALSKLMLLVGAGEPVLQAFSRCLEGKDPAVQPLYKEWERVVISLRNGESFSTAIERFNRCCAVQEVSIFTTVMLLNYRRGGDQFVLALREISYSLWEKRKAVARSLGEEASSKLVFPLVGILLVLMVFVAAPAMLLMS